MTIFTRKGIFQPRSQYWKSLPKLRLSTLLPGPTWANPIPRTPPWHLFSSNLRSIVVISTLVLWVSHSNDSHVEEESVKRVLFGNNIVDESELIR
jgi:hypothetical protein